MRFRQPKTSAFLGNDQVYVHKLPLRCPWAARALWPGPARCHSQLCVARRTLPMELVDCAFASDVFPLGTEHCLRLYLPCLRFR